MKTQLKFAFVLVLGLSLVALGAIGCGSSDSDEADAKTSTLPKALFIKKGDQICEENYAKRTKLLEQLSKKYPNPPPPSQAKQEEILVNQVMPIFWEESEELNDLPLPKEGAEEAKEVLASLEASIEGVEADPAKSLREGTVVEFRDTEQIAEKFGFDICGRS